tara:strand:+ start:149 stop:442 length:294 start_codon:yes stop_codon:yes gene_type:complete
MKITKRQLRRIIKEEKVKVLAEQKPSEMSMHDAAEYYEKQKSSREPPVSAARQAEAVEQIETILNDLFDDGVDNATLITLLKQIIIDINRGFIGQPS